MKIVYGKTLTESERGAVRSMAEKCGITFETARLLYVRGITSAGEMRAFLHPGKNGFHDPFLLKGMSEAVARIRRAAENNESVLVFGDYDADGVCAASVMYFCLKDLGIRTRVTVPEREEGYGLNVDKVLSFSAEEKVDLLITVDCGISEAENIEKIKALGTDVIVTDHHEPPENLPACIAVNPKISGQAYPFSGLCGAGVAYKLARALIGEKADKFLDFAAAATVADSMELKDENRCIVAEGLKIMNSSSARQAFKNLLGENQGKKITSQTLAFQIAPRINAGGRMGDAGSALKAFISEDPHETFEYCVKLSRYNIARQTECDAIYAAAKIKIQKENLAEGGVILVEDESWKTGFIGIVAAKLVEDYCRPVIVFAGANGLLKGSARSVPGFNIYEALCSVKGLLKGYGGHSQAAGVTVSRENFIPLRRALIKFAEESALVCEQKTLFAEWQADDKISLQFAKELELLEPFGTGNRRPLFTARAAGTVKAQPLKAGSVHYLFSLPAADMLDFDGEEDADILALPVDKTVAFELSYSVFNGRESCKGIVKNIIPDYSDCSPLKPYVLRNELKKSAVGAGVPAGAGIMRGAPQFKQGFGTVYAVSDPDNINKIAGAEDAQIYLFSVPPRTVNSCIVLSPAEMPEGYSRIIYADKPFTYVSGCAPAEIYADIPGARFLSGLSAEREDFAAGYSALLSLCGKEFYGSCEAYAIYGKDVSVPEEQFIFCAEVFFELGIFGIKNGRLKLNAEVRNALTNSRIYRAVKEAKE